MFKKRTFIKGTFILIFAGFLIKIIGFFFRIFLSRVLGANGLGIYQLIFPIQGFCYALCSAGIQTAISQMTAGHNNEQTDNESKKILCSGMILSVTCSLITAILLYTNSEWISVHILSESRCTIPLQYLSYSIPFSSIHSCISGYYYGKNKAGIPAWSQLVEQIVRVASIYMIWITICGNGDVFSPGNAVIGSAIGEISSAAFCILSLNVKNPFAFKPVYLGRIAKASIPLTSNRVMLSIFQSIEAILLPSQLRSFGLTVETSLAVYGVLTGMALPFILFPATITTAMSSLLLPIIAEADSDNNEQQIKATSEFSITISILIGIYCTALFYKYGLTIGTTIFNDKSAGYFLMVLSWLCPFMFVSITLASILNGLGHTSSTFMLNIISITIRILCILLIVPHYGISAYLCGMLISQFILGLTHYITLCKYIDVKMHWAKAITLPIIFVICAFTVCNIVSSIFSLTGYTKLLTTGCISVLIYSALILKAKCIRISF